MPSIPQSLLWISLVILWLFVLVPMLINKRDAVRRTSDVALATRVLNSSAGARLLKRTKPASGHRGDPNWTPVPDEDDYRDEYEQDEREEVEAEVQPRRTSSSVVRMTAVAEQAESEYLDVDIVEENSGALAAAKADPETDRIPVAKQYVEPTFDDVIAEEAATQQDSGPEQIVEEKVEEPVAAEVPSADADAVDDAEVDDTAEGAVTDDANADDGTDDEYEYVDDTSGLEEEAEPAKSAPSVDRDRRRSNQTAAAAKVAARKYKFRKRVLVTLVLAIIGTAAAAFTVMPTLWWACGAIGVVTMLYLAYLRRQTRIEERLRRRRMQRMARARLGVENTRDPEFDVTPSRLRRPGAVVLEIDDEDPVFEHLEKVPFARDYDLPKAAGQ